jgi:uncharacterized membrane protein YccC
VAKGKLGRAAGLPSATTFDLRAVSLAEGVRAALSVAAIVAASQLLGRPGLLEAALAAWLTCLCDAGGPIRRRLPFLLGFGVAGAAITAGFGLLAGLAPLAVAVAAGSVGVAGALMLRIYGQATMQVGNLLTVTLVLALARGFTDWRSAAASGAVFLGGSLWATLLTMVVWQIHPYLPARRALAGCWRALAGLAADLSALLHDPAATEAEWERHAREHRRTVRTAIEAARDAVLATVRARGAASGRAAQSWIRLEAAEQIFGAMIALSDHLEHERRPEVRAAAGRMLRLLRPLLVVLGAWMVTDAPDRPARLERAAAAIADCATGDSSVHRIAGSIAERLRIAITLAAPDALSPPVLAPAHGWRERILVPLRANLHWQSAALRHAARGAAAAVAGFAITLGWPTSYGYWLTITLVLTMQPFFAVTITRAVERTAGTVAGGVIGAVIAALCPTPLATAAALVPLVVLALAVRSVNFGLFMGCVTPVVVLLVELARPGQNEAEVALLRALYTAGGGMLALLFSALLWPVWEPERLRGELRGAIVAHGRYAAAEIAALLGEAPPEEVERLRRAAGVASNNAETSLQRALLEPARRDTARLEAALTVDSALRRVAGRVSALQVDAALHRHERVAWQAWQAWIVTATQRLGEGRFDLPGRPPEPAGDPDAESLARIARQLELSAGALARLAENPSPNSLPQGEGALMR